MNITSTDNRIVKLTASLAEKKYRDKEKLYIIEGPNLVREALENGGRLRFIFTRAEQISSEAEAIAADAEEKGLAVYYASDNVFAKLSQTDNSQGILAVAEKELPSEAEFFENCRGRNILVLDRIQDPGNMGTLLRTAEAAGMAGVVLTKGCVDPFSPKTVRASAGSVTRLPMFFADDAAQTAALLKKAGKRLCVCVMNADCVYWDADLSKDVAILIGNEGNGVSDEFISLADIKIEIPMEGRIESLNAGLAGGLVMYETMRQSKGALK